MPRVKQITEMKKTNTSAKKKTTSSRANSAKKTTIKRGSSSANKKTSPKARPVIIDVIEDSEDFSFPDLPLTADFSEVAENNNYGELNNEELVIEDKEKNTNNIDKQKLFFSELVSEIKEKKPVERSKKNRNNLDDDEEIKGPKNVNLYRRLVWRFMLGVLVLAVIIFYFAFSKLTITILPNGELINDNVLVKIESASATTSENVLNSTDFRETIPGEVKELVFNEEKEFMSSGEEYVGEEIVGRVTLINTTNKDQPLIATTRLLTPDNKLYRLKDAVNVPARGQIEADIYTEKPTAEFAINPTTFIIPGLWVGLQDKIYAKNNESFTYKQKVNKYIKASDIEQAVNEMQAIMLAKAQAMTQGQAKDTEVLYEFIGSTTFDYSAKAGDEGDSFKVKASSTLIAITFSKNDIYKLTGTRLSLLVPDDKQLIENNASDITYKFESYDADAKSATLKLSFNGTMILKSDTDFIDKKQLVNLNREQLESYLNNFPEIKIYELKFFPGFVTRVPRLPERITIEIKGLNK